MTGLVAGLGWLLVSTNAADQAAAEYPARALGWRADHAGALLTSAVDHVQAGTPGGLARAERLAHAALRETPLSTQALSVLGLIADARGQGARAEALMSLAAKRGPRERPAHVWLFERHVAAGRIDRAWFHADVLLRADEEIYEEIAPHLIQIASREGGPAALANRLELAPRWRGRFLEELGQQAEDPLVLRPVFHALRDSPAPPTPKELGGWLRRLVERGRYQEAHAAWRALWPERPPEETPHNGAFEPQPEGSPFAWTVGRGSEGAAVMAPDPDRGYALRAAPRREERGRWIGQLLVLGPGPYALELSSRSEDAGTAPMRWVVRCVGAGDELGGLGPLPGQGDWTVHTMEFTVPSGCPAQELALEAAPAPVTRAESLAPVWFDDLRISPAPRPSYGPPAARGTPPASS